MAVDRKVVSFSVDTRNLGSSSYESALETAWTMAVSGASASDYLTTHVEKCLGTTNRDRFIIWLEKSS